MLTPTTRPIVDGAALGRKLIEHIDRCDVTLLSPTTETFEDVDSISVVRYDDEKSLMRMFDFLVNLGEYDVVIHAANLVDCRTRMYVTDKIDEYVDTVELSSVDTFAKHENACRLLSFERERRSDADRHVSQDELCQYIYYNLDVNNDTRFIVCDTPDDVTDPMSLKSLQSMIDVTCVDVIVSPTPDDETRYILGKYGGHRFKSELLDDALIKVVKQLTDESDA